MLTYKQMEKEDIEKVIPLFTEYWNGTGDNWTPKLAYRRIWQVLGSPDSYCIMANDGENIVGFAMGRFETFCDLTAYNLVEIIVAKGCQNQGVGTNIMKELEYRVGEMGADIIQLECIGDEMHEHFYKKCGYKDSVNIKLKSKRL